MIIEILREIVLLVAAGGVAAVSWHWFLGRAERERAQALMAARHEQQTKDLKVAVAALEARIEGLGLDGVGRNLASLVARQQVDDLRSASRVDVHALLQATRDPFLSFVEIESALAGSERAIGGEVLRRILMEMVGDGVIAQLDRDRYFIASDFEAGEEAES